LRPLRRNLLLLDLPNNFIPITILLASLLGSWHCAGMCGAIACSAALKGKSHLYHFGRLISYVTLGGLAGLLGEQILSSQIQFIQTLSALIMGGILVLIGVSFFLNYKLQPENIFHVLFPIIKRVRSQQFFLGLLTGLLPCGWLYTFVTAAIATKSPFTGMLCLFLFWVGTVPALTMMSSGLGNLMKAQSQNLQKLIGILLILAGLYSVWAHVILRAALSR